MPTGDWGRVRHLTPPMRLGRPAVFVHGMALAARPSPAARGRGGSACEPELASLRASRAQARSGTCGAITPGFPSHGRRG